MGSRSVLYYTFGNHMHWVDMEWLWGYEVLPGSVHDMLSLCHQANVKGNVNFDAVGYERLASEAPSILDLLRRAVHDGQVEIVGGSYAQPYGLFHGGESNIRQLTYGVRTIQRLLGIRPRTFWEEEFYFFPQLPQLLRGHGYDFASLFFQWTWHTPSIPHEILPAVWWEGHDGSQILTATRNGLNLHQWPEDFEELLNNPLLTQMPCPGIVQWLELMPSPDWMCRAEVILPPLLRLMDQSHLEIRGVTLSEYLELARTYAEVRHYTLDDVFHGTSLGKNADRLRRLSRESEQTLLTAESLCALASLFGRPYASWDVYPVWELEEAWRELLIAQHHDNDECEGLCGYIGELSYQRSRKLSTQVIDRTLRLLAERVAQSSGEVIAYNPVGWTRSATVAHPETGAPLVLRRLPPFGFQVLDDTVSEIPPDVNINVTESEITLQRGDLSVVIDKRQGVIKQLHNSHFPEGALRYPFGELHMMLGGETETFADAVVELSSEHRGRPKVTIHRFSRDRSARITFTVTLPCDLDAVDVCIEARNLPRPDGGVKASLKLWLAVSLPDGQVLHDHPYGVSPIRAMGRYLRKYPTGDWMTSPQVFETVENPFTALQFIDICNEERGLLYIHDGSQAFLRSDDGIWNILTMYDPWDEAFFYPHLNASIRLLPHGPLSNAQRWKLAQEFTRPPMLVTAGHPIGGLPRRFAPVSCEAENVAVTAFYREHETAGRGFPGYCGAGMGYPFIVRLVELDGVATEARLRVAGPVRAAYRTTFLGEIIEPLTPSSEHLPGAGPVTWEDVVVALRPFEIATLYLDIEPGRKQPRDLDAYRWVWATIHRDAEVSRSDNS